LMKRLAAYPKQNALAKTLREIGRLERTLFTLDWISDPALRRRTSAGLNKGEELDSRVEALSADTVIVTTASLRSDRNFVRLVRVAKRWSEGAAAQKFLWVRPRRAVQIRRATRGVRHSVPRPLQTETRTGSVD